MQLFFCHILLRAKEASIVMKGKTIVKTKEKEETIDLPWADLQRGLEDIKTGHLRLWKPRALR